MKILGIFFLLFLLFIIIITTLIIIFVFWLLLIIKEFIKSKVTKKPLRDNYTIGTRNILLIFTFTFITISFIFINPRYEQARQCIILPNGYTIGKVAVFDLSYGEISVNTVVIRDPKGNVLPVIDIIWDSYRIKLNPFKKEKSFSDDVFLTNPNLYEFSYKGGIALYIRAKKFNNWREIYGNDFIENTPQSYEYHIQSGWYGTSIAFDALRGNSAYPVKNCSVDMFLFNKNFSSYKRLFD